MSRLSLAVAAAAVAVAFVVPAAAGFGESGQSCCRGLGRLGKTHSW